MSTWTLAIDPGPTQSAYVVLSDRSSSPHIYGFGIEPNDDVLDILAGHARHPVGISLVIEQIASMGMAVGAETFETCVWTGRFMERYAATCGREAVRIPRVPIKVHLCGTAKAKDANVRQALIDRYGGPAALRKAKPAKMNRKGEIIAPAVEAGALAGISSHCWSALAVGVVYLDRVGGKTA